MAVKSNGVIHSNAIGVYVSPSANTFNIIAYATSGSLELSRETIDATTKDNDGAKTIILGGQGWTMNVDGLVSYQVLNSDDSTNATAESALDLFDAWSNKTKVTLAWTTGANDATDQDYMYTGDAFVSSYTETAGVNDVATFSVTFESTGDIAKTQISNAADTFNVLS